MFAEKSDQLTLRCWPPSPVPYVTGTINPPSGCRSLSQPTLFLCEGRLTPCHPLRVCAKTGEQENRLATRRELVKLNWGKQYSH